MSTSSTSTPPATPLKRTLSFISTSPSHRIYPFGLITWQTPSTIPQLARSGRRSSKTHSRVSQHRIFHPTNTEIGIPIKGLVLHSQLHRLNRIIMLGLLAQPYQKRSFKIRESFNRTRYSPTKLNLERTVSRTLPVRASMVNTTASLSSFNFL